MDIDLKALEFFLDTALASRSSLLPLAFRWLKENKLIPTYKKIEDLDLEQAFLTHCMAQFIWALTRGRKAVSN